MKVNDTNKLNFENDVYNTVHLSSDEKEKPGGNDTTVDPDKEDGDIKPGGNDTTVDPDKEDGDIKPGGNDTTVDPDKEDGDIKPYK